MNIKKDLLDAASKAYYEGVPIMSDPEFDALADSINYTKVGSAGHGNRVKHTYPLYSLRKVFDISEVPFGISKCVVTTKLDGSAVALTYRKGHLVQAATRGDGVYGQDILDKMRAWDKVPSTIRCLSEIQVVGEVVAPASIKNARNYAAGALNLKSVDEFLTRDLHFVAYGANPLLATYKADLEFLEDADFRTVLSPCDEFPEDGKVYRLNDNVEFYNLGYTAHHPRGAVALKDKKEGVTSKLLGVVWQTGRTGKVTPVAILEPVEIGGALVSRATLHNSAYIEALGLEINCDVEVIRAGEIIPRVVRRL